jgi:hypothetical protein
MKMDLQNFEQVYHTEIDRNRSQLHEDIRNWPDERNAFYFSFFKRA